MATPQIKQSARIFSPSDDELITSNILPRQTDYHLVTIDQINAYSVVGYLATLYLTIFGVCAGGWYSSWIALKQNGLSLEFMATLNATGKFSSWGTVFFLLVSVVHIFWQQFFIKKNMFVTKLSSK